MSDDCKVFRSALEPLPEEPAELESEMPPIRTLGFAAVAAAKHASKMAWLAQFTESPIETLLGDALLTVRRDVELRGQDDPPAPRWTLTPQYRWGRYRVDWALRSPSGVWSFIECDGYEFHSSPEQLDHDAKRDAEMRAAGYCVLRLTGSEINQSPANCAIRIFNALTWARGRI